MAKLMAKIATFVSAVLLSGLSLGGLATTASAGTEVPITYINVAGAGGDFQHRWATFVVPDRDTTASAYGGSLRRYEVHIAKMIEITADQWCQRPNFEGVYWNYQAENGNLFMGQYYISCAAARNAVRVYGVGKPERTVIHQRGNPQVVNIPVLNVYGEKVPQFMQYVQTLKPRCIENLCPGDVTSEQY